MVGGTRGGTPGSTAGRMPAATRRKENGAEYALLYG